MAVFIEDYITGPDSDGPYVVEYLSGEGCWVRHIEVATPNEALKQAEIVCAIEEGLGKEGARVRVRPLLY